MRIAALDAVYRKFSHKRYNQVAKMEFLQEIPAPSGQRAAPVALAAVSTSAASAAAAVAAVPAAAQNTPATTTGQRSKEPELCQEAPNVKCRTAGPAAASDPLMQVQDQDQGRAVLQLTELEERHLRQLEKKLRDTDKLSARYARGEKLDPLQLKKLHGRDELVGSISASVAMMKVRLGYRRRNLNPQR